MKRRSFFGMLIGLPALPFIEVNIPEYIYQWNQGVYTDDPRFPILGIGDNAPRVFLDGRMMNHTGLKIARCKSGRTGWIEYFRRGSHHGYAIENDAIACDRIYGVVEVKETAYETTNLTSEKRRTWAPLCSEFYKKRAAAYSNENV